MAELFVGTIHAFCLELLKSESPKHLKYEVLNEVQQGLFVDRQSRKSGLTTSTDLNGVALTRYKDTQRYIAALSILREAEMSLAKNGPSTGSAHGKEKYLRVALKGVALFARKRRTTEYKAADSGHVSAWYLDEDYDGDCFLDCQMFFDFKKAPNIKASLRAEIDPEEFTLKLDSEPFPVRRYKRIAVKAEDVYGNESVVVREL